MRRLLYIILCWALALPMVAQEETLCIDGTLLFREDFGGNDPADPLVSTTPVQGMTYSQIFVTAPGSGGSMGGGSYLVSKVGYRNSTLTNYSVWHIMDDHTYPNDKTRGYLVEIDALGSGNSEFYSTIIDGLCAGKKLTFSAYVANLTTAGQYIQWISRNYVHPKLSFIISDPVTGTELARYNTDTISHDWGPSAIDGSPRKKWQESADWQLVGMNFTVPDGVHSIRLAIRNNAKGSSTGNDFAMDDIEIRLCQTPDTIRTDTTVCENLNRITWRGKEFALADTLRDTLSCSCGSDSIYYELHVTTVHCEEELCIDGTLLFREDFGGNDPADPAVSSLSVPGMSSQYHNYGNSLGTGHYTVRKEGWHNGIQWHWQDDHTYPDDKTRGYLLEIDGKGGAEPFYSKTIDGLCEGIELTFSAYVVNVHYAGQLDYFGGGYVYPRMKFVLKDPTTGTVLGEKSTGDIQPDWRYGTPETWKYARDNALSAEWQLVGMNFVVPEGVESIQMFIYNDVARNGSGNDFALDDIEIHLCMTPDTIRTDTTVCDTVSWITWQGKEFALADTLRDTLPSSCGFDSIYYELRVATEHCGPPCPEVLIDRADTTVCDTLMPFTWRGMVFEEAGEKRWMEKSPRDCDSIEHVYTFDTFHCEKLWPIIVNKYNWQLLCNNIALRNYFPAQTATAFQWYKNEQPIPGATGDDYAERNELQGVFQLNVRLNNGRSIWSNIIEIEGPEDAPTRVQIYNSQGTPVSEGQMTHGVYLYRYERGEEVWTEKKIVL